MSATAHFVRARAEGRRGMSGPPPASGAQPTCGGMFPPEQGLVRFRTVTRFDGETLALGPLPERGGGLDALQIGSFLGSGAAGVVYEAFHAQSGAHYAVKMLTPLPFRLVPQGALRCVRVRARARRARAPRAASPPLRARLTARPRPLLRAGATPWPWPARGDHRVRRCSPSTCGGCTSPLRTP